MKRRESQHGPHPEIDLTDWRATDMVPKICSIPDCEKPRRKREWCNSHYMNWFRHGDPLIVARVITPEERFWASVDKSEGCWGWLGTMNDQGYGLLGVNRRYIRAHRFMWTLNNGGIPDGMQVDHICRNRACVNPEHLRLATSKQNAENTDASPRGTSGYRGVTFNKRRNKWLAQVGHNGRNHYAGYHLTAKEAAEAAKALRLELFTYNELDRKAS